jgi:hypothetical protein
VIVVNAASALAAHSLNLNILKIAEINMCTTLIEKK